MVTLLLAIGLCACGEDGGGADTPGDVGADADAGADTGDPGPQVDTCGPNALPRIGAVTVAPDSFGSAAMAGDASATVTVEVACFSGPVDTLEVFTTVEPRRHGPVAIDAAEATLVTGEVAVADWLGGLEPGTYGVGVTARSGAETLTEVDVTTLTIEE